MKDERFILILITATFFVKEMWTIVPNYEGDQFINPFPLAPDQAISYHSYLWIPCIHIVFMMIYAAMTAMAQRIKLFFHVAFCIQFAEFIEYFANFNKPWFSCGVHVNVTNLRYVILFFVGLYIIGTWKY